MLKWRNDLPPSLKSMWRWVSACFNRRRCRYRHPVMTSRKKCQWRQDCVAVCGGGPRLYGLRTDHSVAVKCETDAGTGDTFISHQQLLPKYMPTRSRGSKSKCRKPLTRLSSHTVHKVQIKRIFGLIRFFVLLDYSNFCAISIKYKKFAGNCT